MDRDARVSPGRVGGARGAVYGVEVCRGGVVEFLAWDLLCVARVVGAPALMGQSRSRQCGRCSPWVVPGQSVVRQLRVQTLGSVVGFGCNIVGYTPETYHFRVSSGVRRA